MPWTSICLLSSPSTVVLVGVVTQMESLCSLLLRVVTMVVMSLPDRSPDCPRLDFPVNEMSSWSWTENPWRQPTNRVPVRHSDSEPLQIQSELVWWLPDTTFRFELWVVDHLPMSSRLSSGTTQRHKISCPLSAYNYARHSQTPFALITRMASDPGTGFVALLR